MSLTARDIMTTPVVTASVDMSVEEFAQLLAEKSISGVPVVDHQGRLAGVATEADILTRRRGQQTVGSIMSRDVIAVSEDESLQEIALLLAMRRINRVPVLRGEELVGIVSRADVVKAVAAKSPVASSESSD